MSGGTGGRSWVETANEPGGGFGIGNLPYGVFRKTPEKERPRIGVAIGDRILDLRVMAHAGFLRGLGEGLEAACLAQELNGLMALGSGEQRKLRERLRALLAEGAREEAALRAAPGAFCGRREAEMLKPARIGDYTDFYASIDHATRVGRLFRPENPLLPNYKWTPIAYHGRASSIVVSGTAVRRPCGQLPGDPPLYAASRALDYELELGMFIGPGNELGETIPLVEAEEHLFGFCLVNDWSARDIQRWEYQPLGPFLGKNFATTISPWVVAREALEPYRVPAAERAAGDPAPLPYLSGPAGLGRDAFDITLEVAIETERMREQGIGPVRVCRANTRDLYWTPAQMVTHHASNGCNLRPGDLLASGTVSGPGDESRGCLLEVTGGGEPLVLPNGETRRYLEDGDEVILTGYAERPGQERIGFGECRGRLVSGVTDRGC
jgi:fumarylacetoacetase